MCILGCPTYTTVTALIPNHSDFGWPMASSLKSRPFRIQTLRYFFNYKTTQLSSIFCSDFKGSAFQGYCIGTESQEPLKVGISSLDFSILDSKPPLYLVLTNTRVFLSSFNIFCANYVMRSSNVKQNSMYLSSAYIDRVRLNHQT